jgi:glycosyltransferase involved in cell wall biosynthesis
MKLLVFAHTPPPHHGQSYMVQLMLAGFGGDRRKRAVRKAVPEGRFGIECYHVNAQVSKELEDIGEFRFGKLVALMGYCLQAIWCRFRYGVTTMYYIPAPGKHSALYRDWLVMLLCRPFFRRVILHWHAAGLAKWLETSVQSRRRAFTYQRLKAVSLSVVLSQYNRADAEKLFPSRIRVVNNGIPDPCPDFEQTVARRRGARSAARLKILEGHDLAAADLEATGSDPQVFKVLYLAHCTREKGLFDTLEGVAIANRKLAARNSPVSLRLTVAGNFVDESEKAEFDRYLASAGNAAHVEYTGFVSNGAKHAALRDADFFCFPTYYQNENQPVSLIEAMAYGLPILTTRWRSIPELFPEGYRYLVDIHAPEQIADALLAGLTGGGSESFRDIFLRNFNLEQHLAALAEAFHSIEQPPAVTQPASSPAPGVPSSIAVG